MSLYEILGVPENASKNTIDKAFKVLAKKHHPDSVSAEFREEAEENMKKLNNIRDILMDDERREQYDRELEMEYDELYKDVFKKHNSSENETYGDDIDNKLSKIPNWLRWILAIPVGVLAYVVTKFIMVFSINFAYGDSAYLVTIADVTICTAFFMIAFYKMIPTHKRIALTIMSIILFLFYLGNFIFSFSIEIYMNDSKVFSAIMYLLSLITIAVVNRELFVSDLKKHGYVE